MIFKNVFVIVIVGIVADEFLLKLSFYLFSCGPLPFVPVLHCFLLSVLRRGRESGDEDQQ